MSDSGAMAEYSGPFFSTWPHTPRRRESARATPPAEVCSAGQEGPVRHGGKAWQQGVAARRGMVRTKEGEMRIALSARAKE